MKYLNIYQSVSKTAFSGLLCAGVLSASFSVQAAEEILAPSQKPLSLTQGVPPNLLVTLDDSGSMFWGYAPDAIKTSGEISVAGRSSIYNPIYYNPKDVYRVPKKITWTGGQVKVEDYPASVFTNAKQDGFKDNPDRTDLSQHFRPFWHAAFTTLCPEGVEGCVNYGTSKKPVYASPAHYFDYDKGCSTTELSTAASCYTYRKVEGTRYGIDQQQNFAIWYEFYANRNLATRSAANLAFYTMPDNIRLTWGALNTCAIGSATTAGTCNNNKMDRFTGEHRVNFFKWLEVLPAQSGTPLHKAMHRAGEFVKGETSDKSVCRANYHVLMTDGMWNTVGNTKGNADSTAKELPDGTAYTGVKAPYWDGRTATDNTTKTLADSAFYYWAQDLRTDLDDKIAPYMPIKSGNVSDDYWDPRNNPATWQHMVNFTVGLGLSNSLTKNIANGTQNAPTWNGDELSPTFANIEELKALGSNGLSWPDINADTASTIYDLWHAAINSRGEFFSADSPDALVLAFNKIIERVSARKSTGSAPAISSGVGDDGTGYAYQASYAADQNWAGNLTATMKKVGADGTVTSSQIWSAKELLDDLGTARKIMMAKEGGGLKTFEWSNLSTETDGQQDKLHRNPDKGDLKDALGADRVSFLRGDRSKEITTFRERKSVLGDIVGSKPVTVRGARYLTGHANRIEGVDQKYEDFVTAHKGRKPMVYVGANDGMLHGFNANTGVEEFAFVPTAVIENLHKLTGKSYGDAMHQYFVDGSPVVADVFINNKWRTVLVGTLAAGGKGMFALDVTDPNNITLLWEFNEDKLKASGYQAKLGYTFSQPTIARMHNGKWAAVVGNGYAAKDSDNGKAALLIIDMEAGTLTKDLVVQGEAKVPNGMSTPKLADINGDGIADYAFAGDLQGNLWRFDLAPDNSDTSNPFLRKVAPRSGEASFAGFQVSFGGSALFTAKDEDGKRQPITAAPSIVRHPTGNGYIIVVGTGRYYAEGDKEGLSNKKQSIYGVWDPTTKIARSAGKSGFPFSSVTRTQLHAQTMQAGKEAVTNGKDARLLSDTQVPWAKRLTDGSWSQTEAGVALKAGWYFDLVLKKEMMVADMLQFGQTLYFQSLVPNVDPCASGVENWSYAINPASGGRTSHHAWNDFRSSADPTKVITAIKMDGEGGISIGQRPDKKYELCTGSACNEITPDPASIGRQSWRVVEGQ